MMYDDTDEFDGGGFRVVGFMDVRFASRFY